ncbi:MAG: hypothetical protein P8Q99_02520 [Paracoccaceae bacterium]|nr:hypothetical protein [Paracoccaceae bacterium]
MPYEADLLPIICSLFFVGQTESIHPYSVGYNLHKIRIDCETELNVIEVGLDKRSSIDSVHQALFAASLTGKNPIVAIIDTDGFEGQYEYQIRTAAKAAGVKYISYKVDALIRRQMTQWLRNRFRLQSNS